jgi:hypothetical protein
MNYQKAANITRDFLRSDSTPTSSAQIANGLIDTRRGTLCAYIDRNTRKLVVPYGISSDTPTTHSTLTLDDTTRPTIALAAGATNTGTITINGKTSGKVVFTTADSTAQTVTVTVAAQTSGAGSATLPDLAGASDTFALLGKTQTFTGALTFSGASNTFANALTMSTASQGLVLKRGSNGLVGTFVCNGATPVTVNNTNVAVADAIIISLNTVGGTVGAVPAVKTITGGSGFTVAGTASDTSTYNYAIIKNAA